MGADRFPRRNPDGRNNTAYLEGSGGIGINPSPFPDDITLNGSTTIFPYTLEGGSGRAARLSPSEIRVVYRDPRGEISLGGNVTLNGSLVYHVNASNDTSHTDSQTSQLNINGKLTVTDPDNNRIGIRVLPISDDFEGLFNAPVLTVAGGIEGIDPEKLFVFTPGPNFLDMTGDVFVNPDSSTMYGYKVRVSTSKPSLMWHSTKPTGDGRAHAAHGTFYLDQNQVFTLTKSLQPRTDIAINPDGSPNTYWDGRTLALWRNVAGRGGGTLVIDGPENDIDVNVGPGTTLVVGSHVEHTTRDDVGYNINGLVTVNGSGAVAGHGRIGGLKLNMGAVVAPGGFYASNMGSDFFLGMVPTLPLRGVEPIGQLTVYSSVDMAQATYVLDINPDGTHDVLKVFGKVRLSPDADDPNDTRAHMSSLVILPGGGEGDWDTMGYSKIIEADSVEGTFRFVQSSLLFLTPEVSYDKNSVRVLMRRTLGGGGTGTGGGGETGGGGGTGGGGSNVDDLNRLFLTANVLQTARAIASGLTIDHAVFQSIRRDMTEAEVNAAMNNLSGEMYGSTRAALLANTQVMNTMQSRMLSLGAERRVVAQPVLLASNGTTPLSAAMLNPPSKRLWINTWGYNGHISATRNAAKLDQSGFGFALGGDVRVALGMRYGEPGIPCAIDALLAQGCERILVLPLYPQYAASTTATAVDAVAAHVAARQPSQYSASPGGGAGQGQLSRQPHPGVWRSLQSLRDQHPARRPLRGVDAHAAAYQGCARNGDGCRAGNRPPGPADLPTARFAPCPDGGSGLDARLQQDQNALGKPLCRNRCALYGGRHTPGKKHREGGRGTASATGYQHRARRGLPGAVWQQGA